MNNRLINLSRLMPIAIGAVVLGAAQSASAQSSATANATATIVPAISISKTADLAFGLIVAGAGGTVAIGTDSSRSVNGPVGLTNGSFPVSAASFTVTGGANLNYTVSLPTSTTLAGPSSASMTVNAFTSNPSATGTIGSGGTSTLAVGATLTVGAAQTPGSYTGTFTVTVNYQ
jgi:uncharacterized protein DUF4402